MKKKMLLLRERNQSVFEKIVTFYCVFLQYLKYLFNADLTIYYKVHFEMSIQNACDKCDNKLKCNFEL